MIRFIGTGIALIGICMIFFLMVDGLCRHGVKQRNSIQEGLEDAESESLNLDKIGANRESNTVDQDNTDIVNNNEIHLIGPHSEKVEPKDQSQSLASQYFASTNERKKSLKEANEYPIQQVA